MKKRLALPILVLILCLSGCSLLPEEEVRRTTPVIEASSGETFTFQYCTRGDIEQIKKFSATYVPIQKLSLYFGVAGEYVDEIYVKVGDSVTEGQLLAQLKLEGAQSSIDACERQIAKLEVQIRQSEENRELAIKKAELTYSDKEELAEALDAVNASYDSTLQSLNDSLSVARLKLTTLKENLELRRIYAPIDGTITYVRKYTESTLSTLTDKAITVSDSTMSLFMINTEYWNVMPVGLEVTITVKKVEYEAVVADPAVLGIEVPEYVEGEKAKVYLTLKNPAPDLEDNDKGSFSILLDARYDVLRISDKAISTAGDDYIVYYQTDEGGKSYKTVKLGFHADGMYEVLEGLNEGDAVIVP